MEFSRHGSIDLHIHTTASDGTLTPQEIISYAHQLKLKAIAITDHDTVAGSREALRNGIPPSIKFLTGVEISATPPPFYPGSGSFHLLGYSIRLNDPILNQTLEKLQQARKNRNPTIISRLNKLGISITLDEVRKEAGEGQLGRPHIGQLMVKKGVVPSIDAAFDQFLGNGRPAYVDKQRVECFKAIEMIRDAGGVPVLAHPGLLDYRDENHLDELIANLKIAGIEGLEVYYSEHTPNQTRLYTALAHRHGLLMTGGSDFHGDIQPEIEMGSGRGDLIVPYELFERLIQHRFSQKCTDRN